MRECTRVHRSYIDNILAKKLGCWLKDLSTKSKTGIYKWEIRLTTLSFTIYKYARKYVDFLDTETAFELPLTQKKHPGIPSPSAPFSQHTPGAS